MKNKKKKKNKIIVTTGGGFDPLHVGHVRLFKESKKLGDELVVILNNDNWIRKKKITVFMPDKERKELIEAIKWVDRVVLTDHKPNTNDMSICRALAKVKPDIFTKGGDRNIKNIPPCEVELQKKIGYKIVCNVGKGGKVQSSSWLLEKYLRKAKKK
jgi:cytidyltransferase-like protein